MPLSEMIAPSVVPPPMSSTIAPRASLTGMPAPIAAAMGSSIRYTSRAPFDLRRAARHADQHARARVEVAVLVHLVDEVLEHLLRDGEVGDDAVLQRSDRGDVAGRAADHGLRLGADRGDGLRAARAFVLTHGDHRGFVQHDALAAYINKSVGRT